MKLEDLQRRARKSAEEQASERGTGKRRSRPSNLRIGIWIVELLVLLFAVEHFLIRPRIGSDDDEQSPPPHPESAWTELEPLGDDAVLHTGLRESASVRIPPTGDLGAGSAAVQAAQCLVSEEQRLPVEVVNSIGMRFRLIPNGSFVMGSPESEPGHGPTETQHVAEIPEPFYIGKFEVTQAQWNAVMDENPSHFRGADYPVEEITWYDCLDFVIALCEKEGVPKWTYRLPTEREWEYACRAGTQTAYHFGDSSERLGTFDFYQGNSMGRAHPVGQLRANAFGLFDMHGNLWEWCMSRYRSYPGAELEEDPRLMRSIRGGNWYVEAVECRSANRARLGGKSQGNMLGFRVVRQLPETAAAGAPTEE